MRLALFLAFTVHFLLIPKPSLAGPPVVLDRELLGQELQAISLQLATLERQVGHDPNLGAQVTALIHQIKALSAQVAAAPLAPTSAGDSAKTPPAAPPGLPAPIEPAAAAAPSSPMVSSSRATPASPAVPAPPPVLDSPKARSSGAPAPEVPPLPPPLTPSPETREAPPVAPLPPQAGLAIDEGSLQALLRAIQAESFARGKLRVLAEAARRHQFLVTQATQVLQLFPGQDRLSALQILALRILDRENSPRLVELFELASQQRRASQILGISSGYY
jgi:hypothetical protein